MVLEVASSRDSVAPWVWVSGAASFMGKTFCCTLIVHFCCKRLKKQRNLRAALPDVVELPQKSIGIYIAGYALLVLIGGESAKDGGLYL
jgi:hypothetical protein